MTTVADWTSALQGGPILVFGGPYSNLAATRAMRAVAESQSIPPNRVVCTGDVVAYAAEPEETTALIRDWGCHVIAGNCEEQLGASAADCGCGFEEGTACDRLAKGWYPFANSNLSTSNRAWMRGLPARAHFNIGSVSFTVLHGGVHQTNKFVFASDVGAIGDELAAVGTDVVIAGHAGLPFSVRSGTQLWFNPGVIGMPANDGTAAVWYGMITPRSDGLEFSLRPLAYDHARSAAAMRLTGHADSYADTLETGLWPSCDILPAIERAATGRALRPQTLVMPMRVVAVDGEAAAAE